LHYPLATAIAVATKDDLLEIPRLGFEVLVRQTRQSIKAVAHVGGRMIGRGFDKFLLKKNRKYVPQLGPRVEKPDTAVQYSMPSRNRYRASFSHLPLPQCQNSLTLFKRVHMPFARAANLVFWIYPQRISLRGDEMMQRYDPAVRGNRAATPARPLGVADGLFLKNKDEKRHSKLPLSQWELNRKSFYLFAPYEWRENASRTK